MLDPSCVQHGLTAEERRHFDERGYLVVEEALDAGTVDQLVAAADRIDGAHRAKSGMGPHDQTFFADFVGRDPAFTNLIDWPVPLRGWLKEHQPEDARNIVVTGRD